MSDRLLYLPMTSDFADASGNNVAVSNHGARIGFGMGSFDGSAYLTFPNSSWFAFGTGDFEIGFKFRGPAQNGKSVFGAQAAIGPMTVTIGGCSPSSPDVLTYTGTTTISGKTILTDNRMHFCEIRRIAGNIYLSVDGIEEATGTDAANYTDTSGDFVIAGNNRPGGNCLTGSLSGFEIWRSAKPASTFDIWEGISGLPCQCLYKGKRF